METKTKIETDKKVYQRNFRPSPKNQSRIEIAERLGFNVSELINEALETAMDKVLQDKSRKLQKEMERAKGFEPSTFTLARCGSGLKILVRAGSMARDVVTKVCERGALPDSPEHRGNQNESAGADGNWGVRSPANFAVR